MKRRVASSTRVDDLPPTPTSRDTYTLREVRIERAGELVTLADPAAALDRAEDAFVRLQPPEGTTADEVSRWRERAAVVARAVKVLPTPRSAYVPLAHARAGEEAPKGIREEALAIAGESGDPELVALVRRIADEAAS